MESEATIQYRMGIFMHLINDLRKCIYKSNLYNKKHLKVSKTNNRTFYVDTLGFLSSGLIKTFKRYIEDNFNKSIELKFVNFSQKSLICSHVQFKENSLREIFINTDKSTSIQRFSFIKELCQVFLYEAYDFILEEKNNEQINNHFSLSPNFKEKYFRQKENIADDVRKAIKDMFSDQKSFLGTDDNEDSSIIDSEIIKYGLMGSNIELFLKDENFAANSEALAFYLAIEIMILPSNWFNYDDISKRGFSISHTIFAETLSFPKFIFDEFVKEDRHKISKEFYTSIGENYLYLLNK